ncbi:MAG: hypothetical protein M3Q71_11035 [Chloroflexota bacterium]|nr:hypothetical protein [Chloroflexota bacterium]MDP9471184.1 hypothetical protein [Chloroflexota bacterium]
MTTKIATMAGKLVVVSGLALALSFSAGSAKTESAGKENYFVQHPGPAGGHTGVDVHDPYAPVDLRPVLVVDGDTLVVGRFAATTDLANDWSAPPAPGLPGRPY